MYSNGILEKTLYLNLGLGHFKKSVSIISVFLDSMNFFLNSSASEESNSIAITLCACLASSCVIIPFPEPISTIVSFLSMLVIATRDSMNRESYRKFCECQRFLFSVLVASVIV